MNRRALLILLLPLFGLTSCGDMTKAKGLASVAIVDFHRQFNEEKFKDLYTASHADMKAAATEADFVKFLESVRTQLGKEVSSAEGGWMVKSHNLKTTISMTQNTEFEHGKGAESFSFVIEKGICTLQSYYIKSPDMTFTKTPTH